MSIRIFGWFAGSVSVVHNIPKIYKNYHSESCNDISQLSMAMRVICAVFYVAHGALIDDPPLLWMTSIACIQMMFIWGQILYYKKVNESDKPPSVDEFGEPGESGDPQAVDDYQPSTINHQPSTINHANK